MPRKSKRLLTDISLIGIHPSGKCFGYWGDRRVYTFQGIPNEKVDLLVHTRQRDWLSGDVTCIKTPSPHRVQPKCKHTDICGGCTWQHIEYQQQLELKKHLITRCFTKLIYNDINIPDVVPSPEIWYYRNRIEFSFSARRWYYEGEGRINEPEERSAMGFHPANNAEKVFEVEECMLIPETALLIADFIRNEAKIKKYTYFDPKDSVGFLKSLVIRITQLNEIMVMVIFAQKQISEIRYLMQLIKDKFPIIKSLYYKIEDSDSSLANHPVLINEYQNYISEHCNGYLFRIGIDTFYQPNPLQASAIYKTIVELSNLTGVEHAIDLYCGIGTISLHLASKAASVIGIEGNKQSIEYAKINAKLNNIDNVEFIQGDILETFTSEFIQQYKEPDLIVLDPPRSGTLISIKKTILASGAKKLIYLSCNPESLVSDLQMLIQKYDISYIQAFDMFPHTSHIETLVVMELKA